VKTKTAEITLRPFERSDFKRLISWVSTPEALGQWCGPFFGYPLDESKLQRYFGSSLPSRNESSVQATGATFLFSYVG
jgi:hypothetical protein